MTNAPDVPHVVRSLRRAASLCGIEASPDQLALMYTPLRPRTIVSFAKSLDIWSTWATKSASPISMMGPEGVSAFVRHLEDLERTPNSIRTVLWGVRRFIASTSPQSETTIGLIDQVIAAKFNEYGQRSRREAVPLFGRAELDKCVAAGDLFLIKDVRNIALLLFLFDSMAYPDQVFGLHMLGHWQVSPLPKTALVIRENGDATVRLNAAGSYPGRSVKLSAMTVLWLSRWMAIRKDRHPALFVTANGLPLSAVNWRNSIRALVARAGIRRQDFSFTAIRRGFARDLMAEGMPAATAADRAQWRSNAPIKNVLRGDVLWGAQGSPALGSSVTKTSRRTRIFFGTYCGDLFEPTRHQVGSLSSAI
ncbi:MAG TPA: tyrosine-type recombinase/integrase [Xanthomonadaceae bacterium]|jgi:hypothetical protein